MEFATGIAGMARSGTFKLKLKHWCGLWGINGWEGPRVLGFVVRVVYRWRCYGYFATLTNCKGCAGLECGSVIGDIAPIPAFPRCRGKGLIGIRQSCAQL